jgi:hypothetical protein
MKLNIQHKIGSFPRGPARSAKGQRRYQFFGRDYQAGVPNDALPTPVMRRKTAKIYLRVEPQLVERIDAWRVRHQVHPNRTAAIVHMIEHFLANDPPGAEVIWGRLLDQLDAPALPGNPVEEPKKKEDREGSS